MMRGAQGFWQSGAAFEGEAKPPFSREVMSFILAASAAKPGD
jgi:hypothetical protein